MILVTGYLWSPLLSITGAILLVSTFDTKAEWLDQGACYMNAGGNHLTGENLRLNRRALQINFKERKIKDQQT